MKPKFILAGLMAVAPLTLGAVSEGEMIHLITTTSGKVYQDCRIFKLDPDGVFFAHSLGSAKILYHEMPSAMKEQLGYDSVKAAEYSADSIAKQKKQKEKFFELQKEAVRARAFAQEMARQSNEMQPAYSGASYAPPLSEWVGTVPATGWSSYGIASGEFANGHDANWSPVDNCRHYNQSPWNDRHQNGLCALNFDPLPKYPIDLRQHGGSSYRNDSRADSMRHPSTLSAFAYNGRYNFQSAPNYGTNKFNNFNGRANFTSPNHFTNGGFAVRPICRNFARPANTFFAVPALRTATPPLAVRPARSCAVARPVVSHH